MIHLTYSNRTESLLDRLAEAVRAERQAGSPWAPVQLLVANPFLKEYVRIQLAQRLGVAANLNFSYLDGLWPNLVPAAGIRLLSADLLRGALVTVFADSAWLAREQLGPVQRYLAGDRSGLKAIQLAAELGALFEDYSRSRPEWSSAWRTGAAPVSPAPELEQWQCRLWLEAVRRLDGTGLRHLTLAEALQDPAFGQGTLAPAIHAFGLTHVAQVYHQAYTWLGRHTELHLYALNPCGEFWEDLTSTGEALWRQRQPGRDQARLGAWQSPEQPEDFYGLASAGPEALRRWGRPGRENIRLLNDVSECDFDTCFEVPEETCLLHRIQRDVLMFQDPEPDCPVPADPSLTFLAAASARREAEVVATEIWRLLEAAQAGGRPLRFSDIAVVVPPSQEAAYAAHLQAAFQETGALPWTRGEGAPGVLARTLEAAELLLDLPRSGCTRAAMLRLLSHPALAETFGELDGDAWTRWCQALGIVRGGDRQDWAGSYLESDALNWDQGLKRLALGRFMADGAELEQGGDRYPALTGADPGSVGRFLTLSRALLAEARRLERVEQDLRAWVADLEQYLLTWLQGSDEPAVRAAERIRAGLARMLAAAPDGLALPVMGFAAARHLALEALTRLRAEQPSSLARGVVVSCYAPMRAIPFRAVFLLGLGEGIFPGRDRRSALDLRARGRRPGDVSQSEKDKYLFLETLLSTRENLYCSYVAQDELTGEALEPSGLYKEVLALAGRYLGPEAMAGLVCRHPLRRYDPAYFPGWFGADTGLRSYAEIARAEARALWLARDLRQGGLLALPATLAGLQAPAELQARLESWLGHPGAGQAELGSGPMRVSLSDLRRWLECPLTGAAAVRLGLRPSSLDDPAAVQDEPFASAFLDQHGLVRAVTLAAARDDQPCETVYAAALARLQARGEAPFGVFADREQRQNLVPVRAWLELLAGRRPQRWRLGASRSGASRVDHGLPALTVPVALAGAELRVDLVGDLQLQLEDGSLFLETGSAPGKTAPAKAGIQQRALRAYLDHLVRSAMGVSVGEHRARFLFAGEDGKGAGEASFRFSPVTADAALEQLGAWLRELLEGDSALLMPIEAVLDSFAEGGPSAQSIRAFVAARMDQDGDRGGAFSTLYGPVPSPERYPVPDQPRALVEARLGCFLAQVRMLDVEGK